MPLQSRSTNEQKGYDIFIAVSYHQRDSEKQGDLDGCKWRRRYPAWKEADHAKKACFCKEK